MMEETAFISLLVSILVIFATMSFHYAVDLLTKTVSNVFGKFVVQSKATINMCKNKKIKKNQKANHTLSQLKTPAFLKVTR